MLSACRMFVGPRYRGRVFPETHAEEVLYDPQHYVGS